MLLDLYKFHIIDIHLLQEYLGPEIVSHLVMHGASIMEIVKHLITVLKKKDGDIPKIFLEALKKVYF